MYVTTVLYVERDGIEQEVEVSGTITPFRRGCLYLPNGDPGYEDEGGELEDIECDVELTEMEVEEAVDSLYEAARDRLTEEEYYA